MADMKSFLLFVDDGAVSFAVLCKIDRDKKTAMCRRDGVWGEKKSRRKLLYFLLLDY